MGVESGAKSVVDVDDTDAVSARIKHGEQSGESLESCAVTDAGRYGNDRDSDESGQNGWEGTFHSGDGNQDFGSANILQFIQQAVQSCNSTVVKAFDTAAEECGGERRFFRDRHVRCPRTDDADCSA